MAQLPIKCPICGDEYPVIYKVDMPDGYGIPREIDVYGCRAYHCIAINTELYWYHDERCGRRIWFETFEYVPATGYASIAWGYAVIEPYSTHDPADCRIEFTVPQFRNDS